MRPLPAQDRRLLALRYFADLSHPEVAAVLEVPVGTVKVRLHRLRARLADRMEAQP
jgi:RNA polymerase sigma-70 factor (ECF subfamily)